MSINVEQEKMRVEMKSAVLAYLFWWFLGILGAHRFYLGKKHGWTMLIIAILGILGSVVVVGALLFIPLTIWWIIDVFKIGGWIQEYNLEIISKYDDQNIKTETVKED